jgi:hypothetical protein
MPSYRSIGGRPNSSGVERVNRDGQMEVLQMGQAEVTPKQRTNWYNKAGIDPRGSLPEEIYPVEKDEVGNSMNVDGDERTRLPRPHQYSTESRLAESRGDKIEFPKSVDNEERAYGVTPGMVFTSGDTRNVVVEKRIKDAETAAKLIAKKDEKQSFDGNNSNYSPRDINIRKAYAAAFSKVAKIMEKDSHLRSETVLHISEDCGIPVEDVFLLEKVATGNKELAKKYVKIKTDIPGVKDDEGDTTKPFVEKVSDDTDDEEEITDPKKLKEIGLQVGL